MKKEGVNRFKRGTAEYVVRHAQWQKSRGRKASCAFLYHKDPDKALKLAERLAYFPINGTAIYLDGIALASYKCAHCRVTGCKLWREYQTMCPQLLCCDCAAKNQRKNIDDMDIYGKISSRLGHRTDSIGWYVPAIPTEDETGYWGYTSVPGPGCDWWYSLPNRSITQ